MGGMFSNPHLESHFENKGIRPGAREDVSRIPDSYRDYLIEGEFHKKYEGVQGRGWGYANYSSRHHPERTS